jgi:hypothetical protein
MQMDYAAPPLWAACERATTAKVIRIAYEYISIRIDG